MQQDLTRRLLRSPFFPPGLLAVLGLFLLAPHAPQAGLHLDDHGFHRTLSDPSWEGVWSYFKSYVPGRNLYILYYAALYKLLGASAERLHRFGLLLDLANVVLAWALARRLGLSRWAALAAGGLFLVYPNHAETHFWTSAIAMNLLSTGLVLAAGLCAWAAKPWTALVLYALALFDYDQVFFLWPLLLWPVRRAKSAPWLAAVCLAMNAAHLLLRLYTPGVDPGNPKPAFGLFLSGVYGSLSAVLVPMQKLPKWEALHSWAGGPAGTILLAALLGAAWTAAIIALRRTERSAPSSLSFPALFGAAWFFAAYLPNYFWHISARHNYLPSFGAALLLACGAQAALARWDKSAVLSRALAAAAFLFFGLSGATTLAEGYGWTMSARLHERFRREAPRLVPGKPDNLFLLGAPASVLRAPAFRSPDEPLFLFSEATGHLPAQGGLTAAFGRRGLFYWNNPELLGRGSVRRRSYDGLNLVLMRQDGGFACAGRLKITAPGVLHAPRLDVAGRCLETLAVETPVWLLSSRAAHARAAPLFTAANGASLLAIVARPGPEGRALVELLWSAERRLNEDFAFLLELRHAPSGRLLFDSAYEDAPRGRPVLWPALDELSPPSSWPLGRAVRQSWLYRLKSPWASGPLEARLSLYALDPAGGPWRPLGEFRLSPAN